MQYSITILIFTDFLKSRTLTIRISFLKKFASSKHAALFINYDIVQLFTFTIFLC